MNAQVMLQALERIRAIHTSETSPLGHSVDMDRTAQIAHNALTGAFKDPGPKK